MENPIRKTTVGKTMHPSPKDPDTNDWHMDRGRYQHMVRPPYGGGGFWKSRRPPQGVYGETNYWARQAGEQDSCHTALFDKLLFFCLGFGASALSMSQVHHPPYGTHSSI